MAKTGRPTKYDPAMCDQVIEIMEKGFSKEAAAGHIGVCEDTFYRWIKEKPEFSEAVKRGSQLSRVFWEKLGIAGATGRVPGFNATTWIFNMKNRHGWADKKEISGPGGGPVEFLESIKPSVGPPGERKD